MKRLITVALLTFLILGCSSKELDPKAFDSDISVAYDTISAVNDALPKEDHDLKFKMLFKEDDQFTMLYSLNDKDALRIKFNKDERITSMEFGNIDHSSYDFKDVSITATTAASFMLASLYDNVSSADKKLYDFVSTCKEDDKMEINSNYADLKFEKSKANQLIKISIDLKENVNL